MQPNQTPPNGWQRKRIADLFDVRASGDIDWSRWSSEQDATHTHPVYANGRADSGLHGYASYAVEKSDAVTLTARGTLGELGYAFFRSTSFTPIGRLLVLRSKGEVDARYFASYINGRVRFAQENTGVAQLTAPQVTRYQIDLPPLSEQHAIATALSDVDALIAGLEKLIAKKRDLKQAAMQQLLTGQTRLPGFSGEWAVKRLGDLAEMGSGGTPSSANAAFYGGEIPWVAIADMTGGGKYISSTEKNLSVLGLANSAAQMFPAGAVLYAMYASLGECSIATVPVTTSQAILGIRPKADLHSEFLYYVLTSWKSMVKGLGQQGTQANLNKGIVADFKISLPAVEEQISIAAVLIEMDTELVALESRLAKTHELKQGMMQELLTGKTRLV